MLDFLFCFLISPETCPSHGHIVVNIPSWSPLTHLILASGILPCSHHAQERLYPKWTSSNICHDAFSKTIIEKEKDQQVGFIDLGTIQRISAEVAECCGWKHGGGGVTIFIFFSHIYRVAS